MMYRQAVERLGANSIEATTLAGYELKLVELQDTVTHILALEAQRN